jgi:hypothetical protein
MSFDEGRRMERVKRRGNEEKKIIVPTGQP